MRRARVTTVTGRADEVGAALERARVDGRLGAVHEVARLADGTVRVRAELATSTPSGVRRGRWADVVTAPRVMTAIVALGIAGVAVGSVVAVVMLVSALVAWVAAHAGLLIGGGVALGVLVLAAGTSGRCPGLHCGGCRR